MRILSLLLPLLLVAPLRAADAPADPPGFYMGRRIAQTMHWAGAGWLIRHEREREESTSKLLADLRLKPGMVVCDLGCGNGYYTLPMARQVAPGGKVLAVDIQPEMLKLLTERAEKEGVTGIENILGTEDDPRIPAGSCDLLLLVDTYHEFSKPVEMLTRIRDALKPDGLLVLAEFRAEDDTVPIKPEHKMSKAQILRELNANGFTLEREFDGLPWQHLMYFRKTPKP
jgi:cyclopropane fatty-acyl-phospholipid synthase-like methyltransferase